jgi:hypothetical protein
LKLDENAANQRTGHGVSPERMAPLGSGQRDQSGRLAGS